MTAWTFNGTTLDTFGKVTVINDYLDVANRRGQNQSVPFHDGSIFTRKYYDERKMIFGVAVYAESAAALETSFDTLRTLLAPRTQKTLSVTLENGTTRTALASVDKSFEAERVSDKIAKIVIEFTMCEPFFRLSTAIADNTTTIDASPHAMTVTNTGTVEERNPTIILTGPLSNTVITNSTNGCVLTYTGTIASPRVVTISRNATGEYICTDDLGNNLIANITHSGSTALMVFDVGDNTLSITDATHTTGTVKATFYPPFM